VLLEQLPGLLGSRYFLDFVGEVSLVIDEFEERTLRFSRFWVSQDRQAIGVIPDDQVL
jgi:hypothetical protein